MFEAYSRKQFPIKIVWEETPLLFTNTYKVLTNTEKSDRVLNGLKKRLSKSAVEMLFACWLSEEEGIEMLLFNYIRKALVSSRSIELNFADSDVLELSKIYRKVTKEAERMRQFVRFQKSADGIFFAAIEPRYDVLPYALDYFEDRFADQQWIIYDLKRKYALYYNLEKTEVVHFDDLQVDEETGKLSQEHTDENELDFQGLWQQYIKSITIRERINLKLQRQHMPKRFWKFLPEKW